MKFRELSTSVALDLIADPHTRLLFSQFGEDIIIWSLLQNFGRLGQPGFYVDVGACHPTSGSNTKMLNLMGWRGVNIDVNPDNIALFQRERPNDINVVAAVSDRHEEIEFTIYESQFLSTADADLKKRHDELSPIRRIDRMTTRLLSEILDEVVPPDQNIDLLSVDVEGFDERVLRSNNWDRYAPFFLIVEDHGLSLVGKPDTAVHRLLTEQGYRLASLAFVTSIYIRDLV